MGGGEEKGGRLKLPTVQLSKDFCLGFIVQHLLRAIVLCPGEGRERREKSVLPGGESNWEKRSEKKRGNYSTEWRGQGRKNVEGKWEGNRKREKKVHLY